MPPLLETGNTIVLVALAVAVVTALYFLIQLLGFRKRAGKEQAQLEAVISRLLPTEPKEAAELELLKDFYLTALRRAAISFWFSLIFSAIGFSVIVLTALQIPFGGTGATSSSTTSLGIVDVWSKLLNVVAGTIITATSTLVYSISNRAQSTANSVFARVRADNELNKILSQIETLESSSERDQIKSEYLRKKLNLTKAL